MTTIHALEHETMRTAMTLVTNGCSLLLKHTKDGAVQTAYEKKLVWFEKWNEKKQDQMREKEARRERSVVVWLQYPSIWEMIIVHMYH